MKNHSAQKSRRQLYLDCLVRFSGRVNGRPPTMQNIHYWNSLNDARLKIVYEKWKELDELHEEANG